jgi:hypothetical protein
MRLAGLHGMAWGRKLLVLAVLTSMGSCRRTRFPSRGDTAAVVVVSPRNDAAVPPKVLEQEPNDSPEQAQLLAVNPDWPVLSVAGTLSGQVKVRAGMSTSSSCWCRGAARILLRLRPRWIPPHPMTRAWLPDG